MKSVILAAALLGATALPASAAVYSAAGLTAEEAATVLRARKLEVEITTDEQGDPLIKSSSSDLNWRIYFYDCTAGRCTSIQFSAGFDLDDGLTYAKANEWNFTKRFGRAALDDEMDPYVRYDVDVAKGYTSESLDYALATWLLIVPTFSTFIGYD
ncbi:MAG: YbjN domain-containing protein [Caulobacter sp.]|nr:YbjN domain-containing protein [Caulobacter sp.]